MDLSNPMTTQPTVGRFAPSPTGHMHLGNIFSSLGAWLAARSTGPQSRIILRIEDIDTPRAVKDADKWIMDDYDWLGLTWDGEPVYQSQRYDLYHHAIEQLQSQTFNDHTEHLLFPCYCTRRELRAASAPQETDGFIIYPGTCRHYASALSTAPQERHSLRLAMPSPDSHSNRIHFTDLLYGDQYWNLAQQIGDLVVQRSDGIIAYQLAVTVDDLQQGVTQVIRGNDLLRSTAAQLWIHTCLMKNHPLNDHQITYGHLPLLRSFDGHRLAKREQSLDIATLRRNGVTAQQIIGYCAWLLGCQDSEIPIPCTPQECCSSFSWDAIRQSRWGCEDRCLDRNVFDIAWWKSWK